MSPDMQGYGARIRIGGPLTPIVKKIMIVNASVFVVQLVAGLWYPNFMEYQFGLHHLGFVHEIKLWQIATYMFLHGGWFHIIFNLIGLWMFGGELEELWGSRAFLRYYLLSGIGAGVCIAGMNAFLASRYGVNPVTLGASGAIYAVLLAYGMTWPNRQVLLYFVVPIKIKYLVALFGIIEFFGTLSSAAGSVGTMSHIGHLGGLVAGFLLMKIRRHATGSEQMPVKKTGWLARTMKKIRMKRTQRAVNDRIRAKEIIDACLEKIAREGMSSLTKQERKDLEWARRHYYPDDRTTRH